MRLDDTVRIPLLARDGSVRAYALVDRSDAAFVNQWTWSLHSAGYAQRKVTVRGKQTRIYLHRALLGLVSGDGLEGDHRNRDRLDCRRQNLLKVPKHGNRQNKPSQPGASSLHRGVSWDAGNNKWMAQVQAGGKNVILGRFDDEQLAADAAQDARRRLLPFSVD